MRSIVLLGLVAVAGATAATLLADRWWLFELTAHFRIHLIAVSCACAALALWRGPRWMILAFFGIGAWHAYQAESVRYAPRAPTAEGVSLRVATFNLLWNNRERDKAIAYLLETDADIVVLVEVTAAWNRALAPLATRYPYRFPAADDPEPGNVILSKTPLAPYSRQIPHAVTARTTWRGGTILILGVHTNLPFGPELQDRQRLTLDALANMAAREGGPVVVAGDFNHTPFTPRFGRFLEAGGLALARHPGLWPITWRVGIGTAFPVFPFDRPLGVPIDHVLVSAHFSIRNLRHGPPLGSDHLPVVADLVLRP